MPLVCDREKDDDSCPYCNDRKVLVGYNDLATTHPHLAEEWCEFENLLFGVGKISDYLSTNIKEVWWKCKDCGNKYKMAIDERALKDKRHHKACDRCSDRMRNRHMYI